MREQLVQAKEALEQKRIISSDDLYVIFNKETNTNEILIRNGETKQTKDGETTKFKNLNEESIKIITKKNRIFIVPRKYIAHSLISINKILENALDKYVIGELTNLEEKINRASKQVRARKKNA